MAEYYVDENKTIYAYVSDRETGVAQGSSANVTLGLDDLIDLSGQSTIIINRVHFSVTGFVDSTVTPNSVSAFFACAGVAPAGYISPTGGVSNLGNVSDYQEVKGWPLKGAHRYGVAKQDPLAPVEQSILTKASFTKTWTPSKKNALALNRGQELVLNARSAYNEWDYFLSIVLEARRGE